MDKKQRLVNIDPEIMGGIPVFMGTRVPIDTLFDYIEGGDPLDEFLENFPSVSKEQAIAALEFSRAALLASANPA